MKLKAALISQGSTSSKWTAEAMGSYFDVVDNLDINKVEVDIDTGKLDVLYDGDKIKNYHCIYPKGSYRYQSLLRSITAALYTKAYIPFAPESFMLGHDKLLSQIDLQKKNVPMPKAYVTSTEAQAKKILEKVNYPIIMKFPQGTQGKGVMYAEGFAVASSLLDALSTLKQPFIIQEYVETGSTDVRALVVGDKVVAAMKRKAINREKRANIHMGAVGEPIKLDTQSKNIAVRAAKVVGADICAVDMLEGVKGPMVIEVNLSPGLQGITTTTKVNVADKIAAYLFEKTKQIEEAKTKTGAKEIMKELEIQSQRVKEVITSVDLRGNRILLPETATKISRIKEEDEIILDMDKGKILVKKLDII